MVKKVFALFLALTFAASLCVTVSAADFADTTGHWAEEAIDRWSEVGVVNGVSEDSFNPNGQLTRAEGAQIFTNLLKLTAKADLSAYTDVAADAWYADAMAACVAQGIMNGVAADQMNPNGTVTREMFFVMFARALGIQEESSLKGDFTDASEISSWAKGYVYALINNGYVNGTAEGVISPELNINRASVMALLDQTIAYYVVEDGTVELKEEGVVLVLADNVTLTGDADATVVVAAEGAKVSLKGYTGDGEVIVIADSVTLTSVPAGTKVIVNDGVTGTKVNGKAIAAGEEYTVPGAVTGGGSSSGGSTGGSTTGGSTTGGSTTGGSTTGGSTTGGGTTGGSTTGGSTTGGSTTGGSTTGGSTTGGSTTGGSTTGGSTTGGSTTGGSTTGGSTTGGSDSQNNEAGQTV